MIYMFGLMWLHRSFFNHFFGELFFTIRSLPCAALPRRRFFSYSLTWAGCWRLAYIILCNSSVVLIKSTRCLAIHRIRWLSRIECNISQRRSEWTHTLAMQRDYPLIKDAHSTSNGMERVKGISSKSAG